MSEFSTYVDPERLNRKLLLTILDGTTEIKTIHGFDQSGANPFGLHVSFKVERKITAIADTASVRIWNLNPESRGMLAQRSLARVWRDPLRYVRIEAGYKDKTGIIFNGALVRAINNREGPDWITELKCSAAFGQALLNTLEKSWGTATPVKDIVDELFTVGGWASVNYTDAANLVLAGALVHTKTVVGSAYESVRQLLKNYNLTFNVDVDGVTIYKPDYPRDVPVLSLDETTGLIGTPKVGDYGADFKTFLDARIRPGMIINIDSETLRESITDPSLGQDFTVYQVTCNGDTHGDDWFSEVTNARFYPPEEQSSLPVFGPSLTSGGV